MSIPYEKLEQWKRRGDDQKSSKTYELIVRLLRDYCSDIVDINSENVFLQGSYANHTNIKDDSDIDVVVLAHNVFSNNAKEALNPLQYNEFSKTYSDSTNTLPKFKEELYTRLNGKQIAGQTIIWERGCKTLKFNQNAEFWQYVPVDLVPAFEYRKYSGSNGILKENQIEGIKLYDSCKQEYKINYPKLHIKNGKDKNSENRTNGHYKETVRIFKQARNYLIELDVIDENLMPSYALECLLYNVPDALFKKDLVERVDSIIQWLSVHISVTFREQSEMCRLFDKTLKIEDAKLFISKCQWLSDNWR